MTWKQFIPIKKVLAVQSSVVGSVRIDDEDILVLDLEQMLAELFPSQIIEEVTEEITERKATISRDGIRLLFAEDSQLVRTTVSKALTAAGFTNLTTFENGQLCLEYLQANQKELHDNKIPTILVSDIEMPMLDGLTLCNNVKNTLHLRNIYVVMFSSLINSQMILKCRSVGADNYVTKPEANKLIEILDTQVLKVLK